MSALEWADTSQVSDKFSFSWRCGSSILCPEPPIVCQTLFQNKQGGTANVLSIKVHAKLAQYDFCHGRADHTFDRPVPEGTVFGRTFKCGETSVPYGMIKGWQLQTRPQKSLHLPMLCHEGQQRSFASMQRLRKAQRRRTKSKSSTHSACDARFHRLPNEQPTEPDTAPAAPRPAAFPLFGKEFFRWRLDASLEGLTCENVQVHMNQCGKAGELMRQATRQVREHTSG